MIIGMIPRYEKDGFMINIMGNNNVKLLIKSVADRNMLEEKFYFAFSYYYSLLCTIFSFWKIWDYFIRFRINIFYAL